MKITLLAGQHRHHPTDIRHRGSLGFLMRVFVKIRTFFPADTLVTFALKYWPGEKMPAESLSELVKRPELHEILSAIEGIRISYNALRNGGAKAQHRATRLETLLAQIDMASSQCQERLGMIHDNPLHEQVAITLYLIDLSRIIWESVGTPSKQSKHEMKKKSLGFFSAIQAVGSAIAALSAARSTTIALGSGRRVNNPVLTLLNTVNTELHRLSQSDNCIAINQQWLKSMYHTEENPWKVLDYPITDLNELKRGDNFVIKDGMVQLVRLRDGEHLHYLPLENIAPESLSVGEPFDDDEEEGPFTQLQNMYVLKAIYMQIWSEISQELQAHPHSGDPGQPSCSYSS